ncbi:rod shape-determining protein MreD [uncultured Eubacterium sp.]|uniref:rod shape-determining protein MreD n=1 Tax=uncultured Eubacterium sp. TaxID=165185 RepID=UPI00259924C2|nr:rod shape-determining protein MreD [uncultured Eubacterium sp.]
MHKKFERAVLRIIFYVVLVLSCYLIQTTVMRNFMYKPNLLLIATCLIGFIYGDYDGMFVGLLSGLLIDLYFGPLIGFNMLVFIVLGFFSSLMGRVFYKDQILFPIGLMTVCDFLYNFYYYVFRMLLRKHIHFGSYFKKVFIPEIISSLIVTVLIYYLLYKFNDKMFTKESRSELTFD